MEWKEIATPSKTVVTFMFLLKFSCQITTFNSIVHSFIKNVDFWTKTVAGQQQSTMIYRANDRFF